MDLKNKKINQKIFIRSMVVIFFFISVFSLWINLKAHALTWIDDEYHTLYLSSQHMFSGIYDSRNFGATRFLLKVITPFSLFYMANRMGGEHYITGWDYPGWFYVERNLKSDGSGFATDPNIQDFVFMQRFLFVTLIIGSLFLVFYAIWMRYNFYAAFIFGVSIILFKPLLSEMNYVYSNLMQLGVFAVLIFLLISKKSFGKNDYLVFGAILGLIASVKIEGIFLAIVSFFFLTMTRLNLQSSKRKILAISFLIFGILNISELRYPNAFLHYTFANIYHYKTGHFNTEPSGLYQIVKIIESLRNPIIILIAVLLITLNRYKVITIDKEERKFFLFLLVLGMGLIFTLQSQRVFVPRNLLTLGLIISLYSSILFGVIFRKIAEYKHIILSPIIVAILAITYYSILQVSSSFVTSQDLSGCKKIGIIGGSFNFVNASSIPSIPDTYNLTYDEKRFETSLNGFDCIIASWSKNNKMYTHYILPKFYRLEKRFGNDFFFKRQ